MVSGEGAYVALESVVGHTWCARSMTEVVGNDFDSSWGWGGWPLFHDRGCTSVASDATDHITIPVFQGGILGLFGDGVTPRRGVRP
jgi:hypothetical protein